jgi:hypothetical protein
MDIAIAAFSHLADRQRGSEGGAMLRKIIHATLIVLLTTGAVSAQKKPGVTLKNDKPSRTKEQQEYDKAIDRDYQSAIKKVPEQNKLDPWAGIRTRVPRQQKISNECPPLPAAMVCRTNAELFHRV